jgi:hypothetical protein
LVAVPHHSSTCVADTADVREAVEDVLDDRGVSGGLR